MSTHKRGKVLRADERALVYNVIKYFDEEKAAKKYQPYEKSVLRASMATGVPVTTILKINKEDPLTQQSSTKARSKNKEERKKRPVLNHDELCSFKDIIEHIYEDMEIPTVRKIILKARKELNFKGSTARVRGILRNKLGFKFHKQHLNQNLIFERTSILACRARYLRYIRENDTLGKMKRPVVFVGELLINSLSEKQTNQHDQKWMIIHAGSETGFIENAMLLYNFKLKKEMPKGHDFLKYVEDTLVSKLPNNCIIVMNYSPRHNMQVDPIPTMWSTTDDIKKWMVVHDVPFEEDWLKAQLLEQIKKTHPIKKYAIDELLAKHGHSVQRIPPFHIDLNPIEYIWMKIKLRVTKAKIDDENGDRISETIRSITAEDWKEAIDRVKNVEERYWLRDVVKEDEYEDLALSVGLYSDNDTDSDSDTEYEYNWSSSSSEESDIEDSDVD